jgi:uncharacterized protein YndB with AHSA1/START domain
MQRWLIRIVVLLVVVVASVAATGYMLPQGHTASVTAEYAATPDTVFDAVMNVAQYATWRSDVDRIDLPSTDPALFREIGANGEITFRIEVVKPPTQMVTRIADPSLPFGGTWTFDVESVHGGGSTLTITERGEVYNPIFRFISHFFMSQTAGMETYQKDLGIFLSR